MSNFCDQAVVEFSGGNGGNGAISFRREKFVAFGGPDGGNGGNGGNIVLVADDNMNTLVDFANKKIYRAEDGGNGKGANSTGKDGEDMILKVPGGTVIIDFETGKTLCDLKRHGQKYVVARGGKGGFGNTRFKSSINRTPRFAESGERGQTIKIILELKLVADIGIIGFPSSGKSTLISRISNARPKIADYPFTTLIPNLGVVNMRDFDKRVKDSFVVADIPGLIEGAHRGRGLGHKFLKHISRTEALVHLIDPTRGNVDDFKTINLELKAFDDRLAAKKQIIAVSKSDAVPEEELNKFIVQLEKAVPSIRGKIHVISSVAGSGLKELVYDMYEHVRSIRNEHTIALKLEAESESPPEEDFKVFKPLPEDNKFRITFRRSKKEAESGKLRKIFDVEGKRIEQVVKMTDTDNPEGLERIYHFFNRMGIKRELLRMGAQSGDRIRIAGKTFIMRV